MMVEDILKYHVNFIISVTNTIIIGFVLLAFVVGFMISGNMANAAENLNTKLYYNDEYSFSVEYPDGWRFTDLGSFANNGVSFRDGAEECTTLVFLDCLWNTGILIVHNPDVGEKVSDAEERQYQIDFELTRCNDATIESDEFTCRDFKVTHELPPTTSIDGYPVITTIYTMTKTYPEDFSGDVNQVGVISSIYVGNDIWDILSESDADVFNEHEKYIANVINSFKLPASPPATTVSLPQIEESESEGGGCLIATATYGSELAPQVQQLRELRDNHLLQTESGSVFMKSFNDFYYSFSPIIADYERENPVFREMVKIAITPMISSLSILNYVDMDSEAEVLGYGISLILLNVGMYFGVPAVVVVGIRKIL